MKRTATVSDKNYMSEAVALGCILCSAAYGHSDTPAEIHHVKVRHGWGRSGHQLSIPLCPEHHRGNSGVHNHGREQFTRLHGISELDLLTLVHAKLGVHHG